KADIPRSQGSGGTRGPSAGEGRFVARPANPTALGRWANRVEVLYRPAPKNNHGSEGQAAKRTKGWFGDANGPDDDMARIRREAAGNEWLVDRPGLAEIIKIESIGRAAVPESAGCIAAGIKQESIHVVGWISDDVTD